MTDQPENLVLTLLRDMRAETNAGFAATQHRFDATDKRFAKIETNLALLADGLLSLRRDLQTISISVAGHAERLADVETTLELIQRHLNIPRPE